VDFKELMARLNAYVEQEAISNEEWAKEHGGV